MKKKGLPELIFGCIGNLDVQIPLCHLRSSVFDFKDREFDPAYNYEGEKYSDSFRKIADKLNQTILQISESSAQVASGSDQVSNGAQALSQYF